jgi:hypothetical protein
MIKWLLLFSFFYSCSPLEKKITTNSKAKEDVEITDANDDTINEIEEVVSASLTIEPFEATAYLKPTVTYVDTGIFVDVKVPSLEISFGTAEFVQIMRCASSYQMESMLGESVHTMSDSLSSLKDKQTMWYTALRNNKICKSVSSKTETLNFQDYTAPTGSFYYVLNPCITKETSITKQDDCSYRFSFSNIFTYEEQIRDSLYDQARELSEIEQEIQAHMNNSYALATVLERKIRACENTIAMESATKKQLQGLLDATIYTAGFIAGFLLLGKDLGTASMVAELATQLGGMELKKLFDLGEISNSCLDGGKYTAYDTLTGKKTEKAQLKAARYEGMYNIVETYNELEKIMMDSDLVYTSDEDKGDGGLLKLALIRYKTILASMASTSNDVLTLEELQQKQ